MHISVSVGVFRDGKIEGVKTITGPSYEITCTIRNGLQQGLYTSRCHNADGSEDVYECDFVDDKPWKGVKYAARPTGINKIYAYKNGMKHGTQKCVLPGMRH
jgi:hypothetical protein